MEPAEYQKLFELETTHWWFRSLRAVLLDVIRTLPLGAAPRVLDAGCGTGGTLDALTQEAGARACGFDVSAEAARYWRHRTGRCVASVNEMPYATGVFDAVLAVDVLESDGVRPLEAYGELVRVLRPRGYLIVVVPAYRWMLSPEHHRAVHASRRYTRATLAPLLASAPVTVMRVSHVFTTLFPAIAAYRLWKRALPSADRRARSEVRRVPALVNEALARAMSVERRLLRRVDLPVGSSILAVVRKSA